MPQEIFDLERLNSQQIQQRLTARLERHRIFEGSHAVSDPNTVHQNSSVGRQPAATVHQSQGSFMQRLRERMVVQYLPKLKITTYKSLLRAYDALGQARNQAAQAERERDELRRLNAQMSAELEQLRQINGQMSAELEQQQVRIVQASRERADLQADLKQTNQWLTETSTERDGLKDAVAQNVMLLKDAIAERDQTAQAMQFVIRERDQLTKIVAEYARVNQTLSQVVEERSHTAEQINRMEAELVQAKDALEETRLLLMALQQAEGLRAES